MCVVGGVSDGVVSEESGETGCQMLPASPGQLISEAVLCFLAHFMDKAKGSRKQTVAFILCEMIVMSRMMSDERMGGICATVLFAAARHQRASRITSPQRTKTYMIQVLDFSMGTLN